MASRAFGSNIDVFFGVQNLFDQKYFVQTNPSTFGTPRLVNGGVRRALRRTLERFCSLTCSAGLQSCLGPACVQV